ncbi:MAG: ABC transporter permease [Deltaproteobacteria bacterium]|nr:ABC transporter permease [Deltaproteobacteria bacterium]MBW2445134.1 ABC transporter permease [Deltaproteobacteria bacterium]
MGRTLGRFENRFESLRLTAQMVPHLLDRTLLRIAWRNVWRNPRRTGIVVTAVAVGIGGAVLTMAINFGMVVQMVETAISTDLGHVQAHAVGYADDPGIDHRLPAGGAAVLAALEGREHVAAFAPRVRGQALVFSPRASSGVGLIGVDPEREASVTVLADSITAGSYLDDTKRRLLVGEALARRLHVDVGDKVVISVQDIHGDLTGEAFRVQGLFRTASRDFDAGHAFVRLEEAQSLFGISDDVSEVVIVADHRRRVDGLRDGLAATVGDAALIRSWDQSQPLLRYMVDLFDQVGWIVYAAVFVAMAFGIANVMLMAVHERIREIGIITAIGMHPDRLVALVCIESVFVTSLGLLTGLAIAFGSVAALGEGIDLSAWADGLEALGVGTRIVPTLRLDDLTVPVLAATITALVASLWPAMRAARLRPAEAVRHI